MIIDAGMTELLRPALCQTSHYIENISSSSSNLNSYNVVGPICETSDCFGKSILLNTTKRNDILRIYSCGTYARSMASQYNLRSIAQSVYSDEIINNS